MKNIITLTEKDLRILKAGEEVTLNVRRTLW